MGGVLHSMHWLAPKIQVKLLYCECEIIHHYLHHQHQHQHQLLQITVLLMLCLMTLSGIVVIAFQILFHNNVHYVFFTVHVSILVKFKK